LQQVVLLIILLHATNNIQSLSLSNNRFQPNIGNITGGQKKVHIVKCNIVHGFLVVVMPDENICFFFVISTQASGVTVANNIANTWKQVRDNNDESIDWLICGYVPSDSKTNVDVIATGTGSYVALKAELDKSEYDGHCLFGGFREADSGKFCHLTYVGHKTAAMARGRASLHKNAVLNELEGCVREENILQEEPSEGAGTVVSGGGGGGGETSLSAVATAPVSNSQDRSTSSTRTEDSIASATAPQEDTAVTAGVENKLDQMNSMSEADFNTTFGMSRAQFEALPGWKKTNLRKAKGFF
jgi:hypothetical protein